MKLIISLLIGCACNLTFAQTIHESVEAHLMSGRFTFDPDFIKAKGIQSYIGKTRQFYQDTVAWEFGKEAYYFNNEGYPIRTVIYNSYLNRRDSIVQQYTYDSLNRLTTFRKYEKSDKYPNRMVITEQCYYNYTKTGLEHFVTMLRTDNLPSGNGRSYFDPKLMISQWGEVNYKDASSATLIMNDSLFNLPDSLRSYQLRPTIRVEKHFLLKTNGTFSLTERTGSSTQSYLLREGNRVPNVQRTSELKEHLNQRYEIKNIKNVQLSNAISGSKSITFNDSIHSIASLRHERVDSTASILVLSGQNHAREIEIDTLRSLLYSYGKFDHVVHKSGPSEFVSTVSVDIHDCNHDLRIKRKLSQTSVEVEGGFYDLDLTLISSNESAPSVPKHLIHFPLLDWYTRGHVSETSFQYFPNGLLRQQLLLRDWNLTSRKITEYRISHF